MSDLPKSAVLPRKFQFWPDDAMNLGPRKLQKMYESGFAGAYKDDEASAEFAEFINAQAFGQVDGGIVIKENGLEGSGEGRLVIPFIYINQLLPGALPGAAQQVGDCVSHSTKNACLTTLCCDIVSGKPDEVTGQFEGLPDIDPAGILQGALSTEAIYWYRGYSGHGWQCEIAAKVACEKSALWPRKNYPELGIDLTRYSGSLASKYGRSAPPSAFTIEGQKHLIRTSTRLSSTEMVRDMLANGYGVSSCGGEAWASTRDANGFSKRKGSWSHALAYIGYDDRDVIKQKYGEALILIQNSWGRWNSGGRRILDTDIDIPEGSFWALASSCRSRSMLAFSGAAGWPAKTLPKIDFVVG